MAVVHGVPRRKPRFEKAIIRRYAGEILKSTPSHPLPLFSSNADSELDALYDKMNHVTLDDVLNGNYNCPFNLYDPSRA